MRGNATRLAFAGLPVIRRVPVSATASHLEPLVPPPQEGQACACGKIALHYPITISFDFSPTLICPSTRRWRARKASIAVISYLKM